MQFETKHLSQFTVLALRSDERPFLLTFIVLLDLSFLGSLIAALILDRRTFKDSMKLPTLLNKIRPLMVQ